METFSTLLREKPFQTIATYTDKNGTRQAVLVNAGDYISLTVDGIEFRGDNLSELEVIQPKSAALEKGLDINDWGELTQFDLKYDQKVKVLVDGAALDKILKAEALFFHQGNGGKSTFDLKLIDEKGLFAQGTSDCLEYAIDRLRADFPEGVIFCACAGCALSDYSPSTGPTDGGKLICFREAKARYRALSTTKKRPNKASVFGMNFAGCPKYPQVQEIDVCDEFEPRKPGTGYRG